MIFWNGKKVLLFFPHFQSRQPGIDDNLRFKNKVTPNRNLQGGKTGVGNLDGSLYERLLVKLK